MSKVDGRRPDGGGDEVAAAVREMVEVFRRNADRADEERRLPAESVQAMVDAGLAAALAPAARGGLELGLDFWFDVTRDIARIDAAHGWCATLMIQAGHLITYFPEEAQAAVWADGPDVPIAGSVMPVCEVVAADGGYRISGNSPFASGVDHAKWVFVSGMVAGDGPPRVTYFLVPAGSYEIVDTWHTVGMRGTGSKTIATDDVFVPAAHTLWLGDLLEGDPTQAKTGGAGIYGLPFASYAPVGFAATMLGAAEGALEGVRESLGKKRTPTGVAVADIAGIQRRVADVAVELDSAHLLLRRSIDAATEGFPSLERRARTLRDAAYAAGLITGAVDAMLGMIGTAGFASSNSLQRTWRDVRFAACHISLNREGNSAHWGRIALGGEGPPALAIY